MRTAQLSEHLGVLWLSSQVVNFIAILSEVVKFFGGLPFPKKGFQNDVELDIGTIAAAGERCIDKVVMVEETEYDDHVECHHSYSEKCHTTYTTDFEPQQEEVCEENFRKDCFIEYKKVASDEPVR